MWFSFISGWGPSVSLLLLNRYPSAVARLIITVRIDSIYGKSRLITSRESPVFERLVVGSTPLGANLYASLPVPLVIFILWVLAALMHPAQDCVKRILRTSVFRRPFGRRFTPEASAATCQTMGELICFYLHNVAAVA